MVKYSVSCEHSNHKYIQITAEFCSNSDAPTIYLPTWRPGRYELGNFAKNIKNVRVFDVENKRVSLKKNTLSSWEIDIKKNQLFKVTYSYYAAELNAGSSFVSHEMMYVNPVNCFMYQLEDIDKPIEIILDNPDNWEIVCALNSKDKTLYAQNFHEFVDSPWIASPNLNKQSYEVNGTEFVICFNGLAEIPWERVLTDFEAFTKVQIAKFIEFPVKKFLFFIHVLPYKAYHGVEHLTSTVITLGPSHALFTDLYDDLLGVSSHELYHVWNVKSIRPIEMFPYDYQKENTSRLGYLYEGITTYMGDLMLLKSGFFSIQNYFNELGKQLQKHFENFGRFNLSVADSSFDTWLDGYVQGAPGRKVSIYTEGCLLAFVFDVQIRKNSSNKYGLDELMKRLYFQFALEKKGVSEADFKALLITLGGNKMNEILENHVYGTQPFEGIITAALEEIGCELLHFPSQSFSHSKLGFKSLFNGQMHQVKAIYPGSPSDLSGLVLEDLIIAVNQNVVGNELDQWLKHLETEIKIVTIIRNGKLIELQFPEVQRTFFNEYSIVELKTKNSIQQKAFDFWIM